MDKEKAENLILKMVNFHTLFESQFLDLMPNLNNSEVTPLLSRMLNEIHNTGSTTSSSLSKKLNLSVPNTSRSVNALYKLGYINKKQDLNDKRIVYLTLSEKGLALIVKSIYSSQEKFLKKFAVLSEEEIEQLTLAFSNLTNILLKMRNLNTKV
ncbi:MarR family winged helix-turn-helix transcriptional regulator [Clostridium hydrogenum]|uniref:MarR family winged helix-turn-helix transcriptional regulator n=1 Tax=Clostridium hydrogenum TaxID=2855764 RepID=UPI001F475C35|nr:MarR family transcriptional regulator [Clostridium hydrogenum]